MKLKTLSLLMATALGATACTTTIVETDNSGTKVVDVLLAKHTQEVQTRLNYLADIEDMNKANVLAKQDMNNDALNKSYAAPVKKQNKIVIPDTYPQTQWRDSHVATSSTVANTQTSSQSAASANNATESTANTTSTATNNNAAKTVSVKKVGAGNGPIVASASKNPPPRRNLEGYRVIDVGYSKIYIKETTTTTTAE